VGACVDVVVYSGLEGQYGSQRLHLQTGGLRLWRLRLQVGEDMHAWATSEWRVAVGPSRCIKFSNRRRGAAEKNGKSISVNTGIVNPAGRAGVDRVMPPSSLGAARPRARGDWACVAVPPPRPPAAGPLAFRRLGKSWTPYENRRKCDFIWFLIDLLT